MDRSLKKTQHIYLAFGTFTGWVSVGLQFYLIIINRVTSIPETIIRFFSFYTILTNIIVALYFAVLLLKPNSGWGKFFSKAKTGTAIAVYITIVGIVYNVILRFLWAPRGLQMVVDESLHLFIPLLFIFYWLIFGPKYELKWKNVFSWLIYPLVYIICILIRGAISGFYPYPFIDAEKIGYNKVLLNSGGLFIAFLLVSLLFVAIAKMMNRGAKKK